MSRAVTVMAAEGRRVRHPGGRLLAPEGERLVPTAYWHRLAAAGDVIFTRASKPAHKPVRKASGNEEQS